MSEIKSSLSSGQWNKADYVEALAECQKGAAKIKVGSTRKELKELYVEGGGFSMRSARNYVYKGCPYVRVDVEFEPVENNQDHTKEYPTDKIRKISKPYISPLVSD